MTCILSFYLARVAPYLSGHVVVNHFAVPWGSGSGRGASGSPSWSPAGNECSLGTGTPFCGRVLPMALDLVLLLR